jgi:hypothetical protein
MAPPQNSDGIHFTAPTADIHGKTELHLHADAGDHAYELSNSADALPTPIEDILAAGLVG